MEVEMQEKRRREGGRELEGKEVKDEMGRRGDKGRREGRG